MLLENKINNNYDSLPAHIIGFGVSPYFSLSLYVFSYIYMYICAYSFKLLSLYNVALSLF
jgi:hypothetical protein